MKLLLILFLLASCTHVRQVKNIPDPLTVAGPDISKISPINIKINYDSTYDGRSEIDTNNFDQRITEALASKGLVRDKKSSDFLEIDINRFTVFGQGLVFCQSLIELTARAKIAGKELKPTRFSNSQNGYFCAFDTTDSKMRQPSKEALEKVLSDLAQWLTEPVK